MNNGIVKKILIGLVCSTPLLMATQTFAAGSKHCFYIANNTEGSFDVSSITTDGAVSATLETQTHGWPKERLKVCLTGGTEGGGSGSVDAGIYNVASDLKSAPVTLNISESNDQFTVTMLDTDNKGVYLASYKDIQHLGSYTAQKGEGSPVEGVKPDSTLAIVYPGNIKLLASDDQKFSPYAMNITGEKLYATVWTVGWAEPTSWLRLQDFSFSDSTLYAVTNKEKTNANDHDDSTIDYGMRVTDTGEDVSALSLEPFYDDDKGPTCSLVALIGKDINKFQAWGQEEAPTDVPLGFTCTKIDGYTP